MHKLCAQLNIINGRTNDDDPSKVYLSASKGTPTQRPDGLLVITSSKGCELEQCFADITTPTTWTRHSVRSGSLLEYSNSSKMEAEDHVSFTATSEPNYRRERFLCVSENEKTIDGYTPRNSTSNDAVLSTKEQALITDQPIRLDTRTHRWTTVMTFSQVTKRKMKTVYETSMQLSQRRVFQ